MDLYTPAVAVSVRPQTLTSSIPASFAWRFRASQHGREWTDEVAGHQTCNVAESLGDFIVAKGDGTPAYQLAVIADDQAMGVTEVIRGRDLIPSTFRQLDLLEVLGWSAPRYMHVPLMIGNDGRRLAKRHGDTRISWFRQAGFQPQQLWGYLAWTAGLLNQPTRVTPMELLSQWRPTSCQINQPSSNSRQCSSC